MESAAVSIIIPAFNDKAYLQRTLIYTTTKKTATQIGSDGSLTLGHNGPYPDNEKRLLFHLKSRRWLYTFFYKTYSLGVLPKVFIRKVGGLIQKGQTNKVNPSSTHK